METSNSVSIHAVLQAQNDMRGLGPKEASNSGAKVTVLNTKKNIGEV